MGIGFPHLTLIVFVAVTSEGHCTKFCSRFFSVKTWFHSLLGFTESRSLSVHVEILWKHRASHPMRAKLQRGVLGLCANFVTVVLLLVKGNPPRDKIVFANSLISGATSGRVNHCIYRGSALSAHFRRCSFSCTAFRGEMFGYLEHLSRRSN